MAELRANDWFTARRRGTIYEGGIMPRVTSLNTRRGITVLALVLLIIAFVVAAIFLLPYLRSV